MVLATTMPGILVNLMFAGVVERTNKKWLLTIPSAGIVLLAILLSMLSFQNRLSPTVLLLTGVAFGFASGLLNLTQNIAVPSLVSGDLLLSAMALFTLAQSGTELLGPAISSPLLHRFGFGMVYLFLGLDYVGGSLFPLLLQPELASEHEEILDHFAHVPCVTTRLGQRRVIGMVALTGLHCGLTMSFMAVLPAFLDLALKSGPRYGTFLSAIGFGALTSAMGLIERRSQRHRQNLVWFTAVTSGLALILLGLSHNLRIGLVAITFIGFTQAAFMTLSLTTVQERAGERLRARATGLYMVVSGLSSSLGNWGMGLLGHWMAPNRLFILFGAAFVSLTLLSWKNIAKSRKRNDEACTNCVLHHAL